MRRLARLLACSGEAEQQTPQVELQAAQRGRCGAGGPRAIAGVAGRRVVGVTRDVRLTANRAGAVVVVVTI